MDIFRTEDLGLAIALQTKGYVIDKLEKEYSTSRVKFVFMNCGEGFEKEVDSYWQGSMTVEPQSYYQEYRKIKNRLFDFLKNPKSTYV